MTSQKNFRVDSFVADLAIKAPCVVATNANIVLSGVQTVNGVAVVIDDRVLVKDQTAGAENGIYDVTSTEWNRSADWDGNRDATQRTLVLCGTASVDNILYQLDTTGSIVIGTTVTAFSVFTTSAAAIGHINTDIVTATPPSGENVTGAFEIWDADDTDLLMSMGYTANDDLIWRTYHLGGGFFIESINAAGTTVQVLSANPAFGTFIYERGKFKLILDDDEIQWYGDQSTANPPTSEAITFRHVLYSSSFWELGSWGYNGSNVLTITNNMQGGNIVLSAENVAGVAQDLITIDPDTEQVVLPLSNDAATPTLAFGDGDTGFFEAADDVIQIVLGGANKWQINTNAFQGISGSGARVESTTPSAVIPSMMPNRADLDTGLGWAAADQLSLIAGGVQVANLTEAAGVVQMILPSQSLAATPSLAFGDGDTGFYEVSDDVVNFSSGTTQRFEMSSVGIRGTSTDRPHIRFSTTATPTVPNMVPSRNDTDTGIGYTAADQLSLIAGGVQVANLTEAAGVVQMILPLQNNAASPSLAFGDGDTGFYEQSDEILQLVLGGTPRANWQSSGYSVGNVTLTTGAPSSTVPDIIPKGTDLDTGIGWTADDQLSLIAGGVEGLRLSEASGAVLQRPEARVAITADITSIQGGGVIISSYNVYNAVANPGDAATLPAAASVGTVVYIKNDGANSMDVFPALGDNAGAGLNLAVAVDSGQSKVFIATAADTWTQLLVSASGASVASVLTTDIVTATPPIAEAVTGNYQIWDADETDQLASIGFNASNKLSVINSFQPTLVTDETFAVNIIGGTDDTAFDLIAGSPTTFEVRQRSGTATYNKMTLDNDTVLRLHDTGSGITGVRTNQIQLANRSGTQLANIGFVNAEILRFENRVANGGLELLGRSGAAEQSFLEAFTDAEVRLYYNDIQRLATSATGAQIRATINTATPPTTEAVVGHYDIFDLTGGDALAEIGFFGSNDFRILNRMHGGPLSFYGQNDSGTDTLILSGDPDSTLNLYATGIQAMRFTGDGTDVIAAVEANVGLTAEATTPAQGDAPITSSYNVYSTVANIGDAATLPAVFQVGSKIYIKNDGANSMDVFPASGDNAGAGTDTAVAVASGDFAVFIGTVVNATWTKLMGGTA